MKRTKEYIRNSLIVLYSASEIESIIYIIINNIYNYSKSDMILKDSITIPEKEFLRIKKIVDRLQTSEPIQYVLGETEFWGLTFNVKPGVLIPRSETEELVDWIVKDNQLVKPSILDIGTGSGCIAISLKHSVSKAKVYACDVSSKALRIAEANAFYNNIDVDFFMCDILSKSKSQVTHNFDIIVSNPPYVTHKEKLLMQANVLEYEPSKALFVPDEDPLLFYRRITQFAEKRLTKNGALYFEINEAFGRETIALLKKHGFIDCELKHDLNGKPRMVKGIKHVANE